MSQITNTNVFQGTHVGQTDMQNIENFLLALLSCFSGSGQPSISTPGMLYFDIDNGKLYVRDSPDANWRCFFDADNNRIETGKVHTESLAADAVTGAKIANDEINSEHYVAGSIDHEHLANDCVQAENVDGLTATISEINTVADGSTAKNSHTHSISAYDTFVVMRPDETALYIGGAGWQDILSARVYVPSDADTLYMSARARYDGGTGQRQVRFTIGGVNSNANDCTSGYTWETASADVSSISGWETLTIQGYGYNGADIYVQGASFMLNNNHSG